MKILESDIVGSLFWILVGLFFAFEGLRLRVGNLRNPGPGFFPLIMATVLIVLSLSIFINGLIHPTKTISKISWRRQTLVITAILVYIFVLEWIGFLSSTFILMITLFGLLMKGKHRWSKVFLYAAITALAAWFIFSLVLGVTFPTPQLFTP